MVSPELSAFLILVSKSENGMLSLEFFIYNTTISLDLIDPRNWYDFQIFRDFHKFTKWNRYYIFKISI